MSIINLLPPDIKQDYQYARRNNKMVKLSGAMMLALVGIAGIVIFGMMYINQSAKTHTSDIQTTEEHLKEQKLEETQKRVDEISASLKLVTQVLSRQILFSKLIRQVGAAMPANTSLTSLTIGKVQGGIDLQAIASDYNTGSQVQVNLEDDSNKIFDKADIQSITCTSGADSDPRYPCTVSIRASFNKSNSFLLLPPKGTP